MSSSYLFFFFFNDTATTEIYTLSLHDALPISLMALVLAQLGRRDEAREADQVASASVKRYLELNPDDARAYSLGARSEEHTSELQSRSDLVCRLLLEKKKK